MNPPPPPPPPPSQAPAGVRSRLGLPSRLELQVAMRYLRSKRSSWLASLATLIAIGGVAVGVMALIVVLGFALWFDWLGQFARAFIFLWPNV